MKIEDVLSDGGELLTEAAGMLRKSLRAPIVVVLAGSMDPKEMILIGLAGAGDPDEQLVSLLERCLKVARGRVVAAGNPEGAEKSVSVVVVGEDGRALRSVKE